MNYINYPGYPQPANNYSQNISQIFPWPHASLPHGYPHIPLPSTFPPFSTSIHVPPNQNTLPPLRTIHGEFPNHINHSTNSLNEANYGDNHSQNVMAMSAQHDNNVNMVTDESSKREPNSANDSVDVITPTKKKLFERANKTGLFKKYSLKIDPEYVVSTKFPCSSVSDLQDLV